MTGEKLGAGVLRTARTFGAATGRFTGITSKTALAHNAKARAARVNKYPIMVDGRELNPDGYVLKNDALRKNIATLYTDLVKEMETDQFQFRVTGGDRYTGSDDLVYSSTDGSLIGKSGAAHLRGDAVDLRIKYHDGKMVPVNVVRPSVDRLVLFFDSNAMPHRYSDRHYHLQLPKKDKQ